MSWVVPSVNKPATCCCAIEHAAVARAESIVGQEVYARHLAAPPAQSFGQLAGAQLHASLANASPLQPLTSNVAIERRQLGSMCNLALGVNQPHHTHVRASCPGHKRVPCKLALVALARRVPL